MTKRIFEAQGLVLQKQRSRHNSLDGLLIAFLGAYKRLFLISSVVNRIEPKTALKGV